MEIESQKNSNENVNWLVRNPFTELNCDRRIYTYQVLGEKNPPKFTKSMMKSIERQLMSTLGETHQHPSFILHEALDEILQANYIDVNSKNLCATCWCLCSRYQWKQHKEVGHLNIVTPKWFKDIKEFFRLC